MNNHNSNGENKRKIQYKRKLIKKKFSIKNPKFSYLNISSTFIFTEEDYLKQLGEYKNRNLIKLSNEGEIFLKKIINEINIQNSIKNNEEFIELNVEMYNRINNFNSKTKYNDNELITYVKNKIQNNINRASLSCRKIASAYFEETGKYIGKSTIHKIIRHKLDYHYLKTTKKSNYLITYNGISASLVFIKVIIKCLKKGFQFIYIDESSVESNNTHFRCWRKQSEHIYFGNNKKEKLNLIAAITKDKILYYELNESNTNAIIFLNFIKKVKEIIYNNPNNKYILLMDNFTGHKTPELMEYYKNEKLNVIFNIPYSSYFNTIELCFRGLKKRLYSNIYNSKKDMELEVKQYLQSSNLAQTLLLNYKETLFQYLSFSQKYKYKNLNNYD